jgi:hypothetical protein
VMLDSRYPDHGEDQGRGYPKTTCPRRNLFSYPSPFLL